MPSISLSGAFSGNQSDIYDFGSITYAIGSPTQGESLSYTTSQVASTTLNAISIVGTTVYRGDGTNAVAIGNISSTQNGSSGTLTINLISQQPGFTNGDFSNTTLASAQSTLGAPGTQSVSGWTIVRDRVFLNGSNTSLPSGGTAGGVLQIGNYNTPNDTSVPSGFSSADRSNAYSATFSTEISVPTGSNNPPSTGGGNALKLSLSGFVDPPSGNNNNEKGIIHGPYAISDPFTISAGSDVFFEWTAISAGDAYDVYGYLLNTGTGATIELVNETGSSPTATRAWDRNRATVSANGDYRFVFVSGSADYTGGTVLGASLLIDSLSVAQAAPQAPINSSNLSALTDLISYNNTSQPSSSRQVTITATEFTTYGSDTRTSLFNTGGQTSSGSSGGGDGAASQPTKNQTDNTPFDPAPAGTNRQSIDTDGDGLREVIRVTDGTIVDGNRDGIPDTTQAEVAGLRLINDGALASDYGAIVVSPEVRLSAITLTASTTDGSIPVTARGGGTVVTTTPDGIANAFVGVVSFNVSGVTPGGSTQATVNFPTGLPAGSGNAYIRFNYSTNRFEEYVDASGTPLYSFVDNDGDGVLDAVRLTLVDGDPTWDGDGSANGTVVDPGFLAFGERTFNGTKRKDVLTGNILANTINGRKKNDWLQGGLGADVLIGGKGKDRYVYVSADESTSSARDTVTFGKQDRFVFSSFDGDSTTEGRQKLSFIGKDAFSGVAGELRAARSLLEADINGDSLADFAVNLRRSFLLTERNLVL